MTDVQKQSYRLGLDLGTNSIGWAILALNKNSEPYKIIDAGTRIFSDGRNPKDGTPLAVARREARGMRRRRDRFLARKSKLMNCLIHLGLMPKDEIERKKLELLNPYELRAKALDEALNPHELGRAIFHLNQRRGFKSNRKEQVSDDKKLSETKQNQEDLKKKIIETNSRTLGEFFYKERISKELPARAKPDESGLYPTRDMYEYEFDAIKETQFQNQKLNEKNWQEIREIIFHQRPLKPQEKGVCRFLNIHKLREGKLPPFAIEVLKKRDEEKFPFGIPRAYLALPSYVQFKILSDANNLELLNKKTGEEIFLKPEERAKIIKKLNNQKSDPDFKTILKEISTKAITYSPDDFEFNLQRSRKSLEANKTDNLLKEEEYFGQKWSEKSLEERDRIVEFLFDKKDEDILKEALENWNLTKEQAENIVKLNIGKFGKTSVGNMSKEILQRLVTEIEKQNSEGKKCTYNQALKNLEIDHSDEVYANGNRKELSYYGEAIPTSVVKVKIDKNKKPENYTEEERFGKIANPTVHAALNQLRKVVNAIIDENGNPSEIHVELARDLKISKDEKREIETNQSKNQKENERFAKDLKDFGQENTYSNRLKLKLWEELNLSDCNDRKCPFCGTQIGRSRIFSPEIEVEHILPFSKTYDDSIANKTLAHRSCNQKKGNRSPFEAFGDTTFERIQNLPKNKRWRFYENAMEKFQDESGFQERQLNDTRYLSRIARQYLAQVCDPNKIRVANGKLTALLRHNWGLNSILNKELFDPETGEILKSESSEKNKKSKPKNRDDHRHHAVDAIVIAMTETKLLQQISRDNARGHDLDRLVINLPGHWNRFREDAIEAIEKIIVSHRPDHGKNTQLHEETYYGVIESPITLERKDGKNEGYNFVYSKPLASLSDNEIERIRDEKIYRDLKKKLEGVTGKKEIGDILSNYKLLTRNGEVKVKNIRLVKKENRFATISNKQISLQKKEIGGVEEKTHSKAVVGSNHHIAIWELPKLEFLPLIHLKGKKLETALDKISEAERAKFERFKTHQEKLKNWIAKDCTYAVSCASSFEAAKGDENQFKPHPAARLITKIHGKDLVKVLYEGKEEIVRITKLNPAGNKIIGTSHNAAGKEAKEFYLPFSSFKDTALTKIFITPIGKIFDSGPILKTKTSEK